MWSDSNYLALATYNYGFTEINIEFMVEGPAFVQYGLGGLRVGGSTIDYKGAHSAPGLETH